MLKDLVVKCIIYDILDINDDTECAIRLFDGVNFNGELFVGGHGGGVGLWVRCVLCRLYAVVQFLRVVLYAYTCATINV